MKSRTIKYRSKKYLLFAVMIVNVLLCACGDDQEASSRSSSDSGSLRFNLFWQDHADLRAVQTPPSGDVCVDYQIKTIAVDVYNSSNEVVAWQNWDCDSPDRRGTITDVPTGSDMYVAVKGFVAGNIDDPDWKGQSERFSLSAGEIKYIDNVVMAYTSSNLSAPSVSTHYPDNEQTGVALNPVITATFSEDVVPASVTLGDSSSCALFESDTTNQVPCTVKYNSQTVTITPEESLSPNLTYTVTINGSVEDLAGLPMGNDFSWNFTTKKLPSDLHGVVEALENGKVRISYDFSSADQLLDWDTPEIDSTHLEIVDGKLKVSYVGTSGDFGIARFKKELRTDLLQYDAEVINTNDIYYHINFYVRTLWDNSWKADQGYGGIHRGDGRLFAFKGVSDTPSWGQAIVPNHQYEVVVKISTNKISWDIDGDIETRQGQFDTNTNRSLLLGGWRSTVLFDNIVIEGEMNE